MSVAVDRTHKELSDYIQVNSELKRKISVGIQKFKTKYVATVKDVCQLVPISPRNYCLTIRLRKGRKRKTLKSKHVSG